MASHLCFLPDLRGYGCQSLSFRLCSNQGMTVTCCRSQHMKMMESNFLRHYVQSRLQSKSKIYLGLSRDRKHSISAWNETSDTWVIVAKVCLCFLSCECPPIIVCSVIPTHRPLPVQVVSRRLFFARDPLGRRSLLIHKPTLNQPHFLLASVSAGNDLRYTMEELSTNYIYSLDLQCLSSQKDVRWFSCFHRCH